MDDKNLGLYITAIVAIVAIIGIMFMSSGRLLNEVTSNSNQKGVVGQATMVAGSSGSYGGNNGGMSNSEMMDFISGWRMNHP